MATSGSASGNTVTYGNYFFVNWQLASQDVSSNGSHINWQAYHHFISSDTQLDNGFVTAGWANRWANSGRVKNYEGNFSTRDHFIASGSFFLGHNADGTQSLYISGGITQYSGQRSQFNDANWSLPTIPRASNPTWSKSLYTIGDTLTVNMNRASSAFTHNGTIQVPDGTNVKSFSGAGASYSWTPNSSEINNIYSKMPNTNTASLGVDVDTYNGSTFIGSGWQNVNIQTNVAVCKPVFTTIEYEDTNSTTTAITGNDQYLIQGVSTLRAIVSSTNKAVAQKSATMSKYIFAAAGKSSEQAYSTSTINKDIGTINAGSNQTLRVTAVDSRGNTTFVDKTVTMVPYAAPTVVLTAQRLNNFEDDTTISISGAVALLTIGGVNKNDVDGTSGVQYRYKETGGSFGSWTNVASTLNATTGAVTTDDFVLELDNTKQYEFEAQITDVLNTSTDTAVVTQGKSIFRIGLDKKVYNNEQTLYPCPFKIGDVVISTSSANPSGTFEDTSWAAWGAGRVPVGYTSGDSDFNASEKTGGSKTVTLTANQSGLRSHNHTQVAHNHGLTAGYGDSSPGFDSLRYQNWAGEGQSPNHNEFMTQIAPVINNVSAANAVDAHSNQQQFITAYMWKRTA